MVTTILATLPSTLYSIDTDPIQQGSFIFPLMRSPDASWLAGADAKVKQAERPLLALRRYSPVNSYDLDLGSTRSRMLILLHTPALMCEMAWGTVH